MWRKIYNVTNAIESKARAIYDVTNAIESQARALHLLQHSFIVKTKHPIAM
jgi:hypothetical protein